MIKIDIKLPDYCKSTKNPRFKIVQVETPNKWLPTYSEIIEILQALDNCEKYNRDAGKQQNLIQIKQEDNI